MKKYNFRSNIIPILSELNIADIVVQVFDD